MSKEADFYEILGVDTSATRPEIQRAYRRRAKLTHPDMPGGSHHEFELVELAKTVLLDPIKRVRYDQQRRATLADTILESRAPDVGSAGNITSGFVPSNDSEVAAVVTMSRLLRVEPWILLAPWRYGDKLSLYHDRLVEIFQSQHRELVALGIEIGLSTDQLVDLVRPILVAEEAPPSSEPTSSRSFPTVGLLEIDRSLDRLLLELAIAEHVSGAAVARAQRETSSSASVVLVVRDVARGVIASELDAIASVFDRREGISGSRWVIVEHMDRYDKLLSSILSEAAHLEGFQLSIQSAQTLSAIGRVDIDLHIHSESGDCRPALLPWLDAIQLLICDHDVSVEVDVSFQ